MCVYETLRFLQFHASVLEPHFDLILTELQRARDLHPTRARQVPAVVELLLQLRELFGAKAAPGQCVWTVLDFIVSTVHFHRLEEILCAGYTGFPCSTK